MHKARTIPSFITQSFGGGGGGGGGRGAPFILCNIGCSLGNCCAGSADVQCDFLVCLVDVVFSCPGGLLWPWMMSYVCILMTM